MVSLVEPEGIQAHSELFCALPRVLLSQIATIEKGFLEVRMYGMYRTEVDLQKRLCLFASCLTSRLLLLLLLL
jgi:hypothetical protein